MAQARRRGAEHHSGRPHAVCCAQALCLIVAPTQRVKFTLLRQFVYNLGQLAACKTLGMTKRFLTVQRKSKKASLRHERPRRRQRLAVGPLPVAPVEARPLRELRRVVERRRDGLVVFSKGSGRRRGVGDGRRRRD